MSDVGEPIRDDTTKPKPPLVCSCEACRRLGHPWRVGDETATTDSGAAAPVDGSAWE